MYEINANNENGIVSFKNSCLGGVFLYLKYALPCWKNVVSVLLRTRCARAHPPSLLELVQEVPSRPGGTCAGDTCC